MTGWQVDPRGLDGGVWEVAIVGGGPAGAVAALHLARGGCNVLVLERSRFPRDKVCGDALIADSIRVLDRAGLLSLVEASAVEATSLRLFSPSETEVVVPTRALVVKRRKFDELLISAAAGDGAVVARGTVERIEAGSPSSLWLQNGDRPIRARIVIIATGANVRLLESLNMVQEAKPSVVALRRYVRSEENIDHLVFSFDRHIAPGYAWLFPLGDGEYNVGCGVAYGGTRSGLTATLDRFLNDFAPLHRFSSRIQAMEPLKGAVLRCGLKGAAAWRPPGILAVGETIGTTFPFTGEGIGKAMETGERAAALVLKALQEDDLGVLERFPAEVEALRIRYRGYELAERWVAFPWLTELVLRLARRSPHAIRCAEAVLNETADPRELFSLRGVWNMLRS